MMTYQNRSIVSCTQLNQLFFEQYPHVSFLFVYMLIAIVASWLEWFFFIVIIAILTIRLGSSSSIGSINIDHSQYLQDKTVHSVI
jgi:hypothetical protein